MKYLLSLSLFGGIGASAAVIGNNAAQACKRSEPSCPAPPQKLSLGDPPYEDYFYSDCNLAAQVVVTSPLPQSDLTRIGPRLIVAWPAGDSGLCTFYAPQNGQNGTLSIELVNSTVGNPLAPVYHAPAGGNPNPSVGVQSVMRFNNSAELTVPILGSIRTIRDFTEGPSLLYPEIQNANNFTANPDGSATVSRLWLDNVTTTSIRYTPYSKTSKVTVGNRTVKFEAGDYLISAEMNYPQMEQLSPSEVLNKQSQNLISEMPGQTTALSFLSYSEKLLAGAWRFLTYFGRDSMISALLMQPVLSSGNGSAMEAVIGAVLERANRSDGSLCHEETIGDYATWVNLLEGIHSTEMSCDYKMIDTDYYLPVLMQRYFLQTSVGRKRVDKFLSTPAGSIDPHNKGLTWGQLAEISANKIMTITAPFVHRQTEENLIHLKEGQIVGDWRDSTYGIGGGRIPYDVNTALVPAALRSIAALAQAGIYSGNHQDWAYRAPRYAKVWEDHTLPFFEVTVPQDKAKTLVAKYKNESGFAGPDEASEIDTDVTFWSLSLNGYDNLAKVEVMNTDDCFRHFLLNTTNDAQLTRFLNNSASNVRRTFPAGLMTDASMVIANPAFGGDPVYAKNWTTGAYHGTVVWSWQLAMMAKGLELQMNRCGSSAVPAFCADSSVFDNVKTAYNVLWDSIEANTQYLSSEVWSWIYRNGHFDVVPLGAISTQTESDIRQLWSLSFLSVTRNKAYS